MGEWINFDNETIRQLLYHLIGIIEFYNIMDNTTNCNDCGNINNCGIAPNYGEQVRYNCHLWKPKEKIEGEGKGWTVEYRRGEE